MQRLGNTGARCASGGVVDNDVVPTRLDPIVHGAIEVGRRRVLGLHQRGVEIVVEQVQPQDIRGLRDFRHRHEVRRNRLDVCPARLLRQRTHVADRIVLEVADLAGTKL